MPRDQMRDASDWSDSELGERGVPRRVRGPGRVPDGDAGGAPRVPGTGGEAPRRTGKGAVGAGRPRNVAGTVQGNGNRALILAALPGDFHHVIATTGMGKTTVWRWLKDLHAKGESHVTGWKRSTHGGPFIASYAPGPGVDAVCHIKPFTEKQKQRRHIARAKQDGRWEERQARQRALWWADRALTNRDPMIAALFGPAPARRTTTLETA